jgi:hypothetical protein
MKSNYIYIFFFFFFFFFFKLIIYFNDLQITFIPHFYLFSSKDIMLQKLHSNGIYYNRQSPIKVGKYYKLFEIPWLRNRKVPYKLYFVNLYVVHISNLGKENA